MGSSWRASPNGFERNVCPGPEHKPSAPRFSIAIRSLAPTATEQNAWVFLPIIVLPFGSRYLSFLPKATASDNDADLRSFNARGVDKHVDGEASVIYPKGEEPSPSSNLWLLAGRTEHSTYVSAYRAETHPSADGPGGDGPVRDASLFCRGPRTTDLHRRTSVHCVPVVEHGLHRSTHFAERNDVSFRNSGAASLQSSRIPSSSHCRSQTHGLQDSISRALIGCTSEHVPSAQGPYSSVSTLSTRQRHLPE